ncbi:MAG: DUF402 domain-containing protein [Nocardioides sp.]|nr:DUF402 domain-containing protein [Nocardioides sp.]
MESDRLELGTPVEIVMTKWPDLPHWVYPGRYLGSDLHGDWIGIPRGTRMKRPGADYEAKYDQVCLVPAPGPDEIRGWCAAFHGAGGPVDVYVDIATPPVWEGTTVHAVDLDLDVVRGTSGRVWVDDEDEFAEHRVSLGYPQEVVDLAVRSCDHVHSAVAARAMPFDGTHLARLSDVGGLH